MLVEGRVRDVTDVGDAVVETAQGIVLVPGALPAERVRVRTSQMRAGVLRGELVTVLEQAPARVEPACAIAARCGGCPLMSLALPAQHELKLRRVQRAVEGLTADGVQVALESCGSELGYRRRARLAYRKLGSGLVLGYHVHAARQLVDVAHCPVLTPPLTAALGHVREVLGPALTGTGSLELDSAPLDGSAVYVSVRADAALPPEAYRAAERLSELAPITSVALRVADGAAARFGEPEQAALGPDGQPMRAPRHGFSQAHAAVNARMTELVVDLAQVQDLRVTELYAGHGNFTLALAQRARALLAVEGDARAVDACRENLSTRKLRHARVLSADVRALQLREPSEVLVLDPPRGGCARLAELAVQARAQTVVYVSCHMTTLQRDLRALHHSGYVADRVHALDMFPQTGHVEAVVRMRKRAS